MELTLDPIQRQVCDDIVQSFVDAYLYGKGSVRALQGEGGCGKTSVLQGSLWRIKAWIDARYATLLAERHATAEEAAASESAGFSNYFLPNEQREQNADAVRQAAEIMQQVKERSRTYCKKRSMNAKDKAQAGLAEAADAFVFGSAHAHTDDFVL